MLLSQILKLPIVLSLFVTIGLSTKTKVTNPGKESNFGAQKRQLDNVVPSVSPPAYASLGDLYDIRDLDDYGSDSSASSSEIVKVIPDSVEMYRPKEFSMESQSSDSMHSLSTDEDDESNESIKTLLDVDEVNVKDSQHDASRTDESSMSSIGGFRKIDGISSASESMNVASKYFPLMTGSTSGRMNGAMSQRISSMHPSSFAESSGSNLAASGSAYSAGFGSLHKTGSSILSTLKAAGKMRHRNAGMSVANSQFDSQSLSSDEETQIGSASDVAVDAVHCRKCPTCAGCTEAIIKISIPVDCLKCPDCAECNNNKLTENIVKNCCPNTATSIDKDNCPVCPVFNLKYCQAFSRDVEEKSGVNFLVQVGITEPWDEAMSSAASEKFQTVRRKIQDLVLKTYVDHPTYQDTLVMSLKSMKGITVAETLIRFSKHGKGDMQRLHRALACGCGCELVDNSVLIINSVNSTDLVGRCPAACLVSNACANSDAGTDSCDPSCCAGTTVLALVPVPKVQSLALPMPLPLPVPDVVAGAFPAIGRIMPGCGVNCPAFCMPLCTPECCGVNVAQFRRAKIGQKSRRDSVKQIKNLQSQ